MVEYGKDWHNAGRQFVPHFSPLLSIHPQPNSHQTNSLNRQNVHDDFQFAAKHLVSRGYTSHSKLAINGNSNGGLLVGVSINQAPELFGAAVAEVGVMDMLRFHLFRGRSWSGDYGNPEIKEDFEYNVRCAIRPNQRPSFSLTRRLCDYIYSCATHRSTMSRSKSILLR